jgi:hypothetical protein
VLTRRGLIAGAAGMVGRGGMPPRRIDQGTREPTGVVVSPGARNVVRARVVIITGAGGGEFVYDASNNLRSANVGATTTDPVQHITCQQGFSTFNGHGAVVSLLSTAAAKAAYFEYADTGSATQGALIASDAASSGTDPVNGSAYVAGVAAYVSIAAGTGAGRYAVALADQATPWAGFAALTLQNLTHPATPPPGVLANVDPAAGAELSLQSGLGTGATFGTAVNLFDGTGGPPAISSSADLWTMNPATLGGGVKTLLRIIGSLRLDNIATPPAVSGGVRAWADVNGFPLFVPDTASSDTTVYQVGHRLLFNGSNFAGNSTSPLAITGLQAAQLGPGTYHVKGMINIAQGAVTSGQRIAFSGSCAVSSMRISGRYADTTALVDGNPIEITALAGTPQAQNMTANDIYDFWFEGIINVSAAGSFGPTIQNLTAGDTCTIGANSHMVISPAN